MRKRKKSNLIQPPKMLLLFTLITMIIVIGFSISRYKTTLASKDTTTVATTVLNLLSNDVINVPLTPIAPDNKFDYLFELSNKQDNNQNEVSLQYTIELSNLANLPLEFILYRYNEITKNYEKVQLNANVTDKIEMNVNETNNHKYKVEIIWKENTANMEYNNYKYSKTIDYMKIKVNVVQKD